MNKKFLSILLVLVLMLSMLLVVTGCGEKEEDDDDSSSKKSESSTVDEENFEENDRKRGEMETAKADMSKQEIETFNATFKKYEGDSVKGSSIKTLLDEVITTNMSSNYRNNHVVTIEYDGEELEDEKDIRTTKNKISSQKSYSVSFEYDDDGLIETITVK